MYSEFCGESHQSDDLGDKMIWLVDNIKMELMEINL
jgi:hypothetical protein